MRLASLAPRSLRGRTLVLALAAIVACEALTLAIFGYYRHSFLSMRARDYMASHMLLVREALRHASPDELARAMDRVPNRRMRLVPAPPVTASPLPQTPEPYSEALVAALKDDYGASSVRFTGTPTPAMFVQVAPGSWWLMTSSSRFDVPVPWAIVGSTLAAVALTAIMVAYYAAQLSRPLRALALAAGEFEIGKRPDLPLQGPAEVQAVTEQFNAMAERLDQNEAERRVMLAGLPHDLRAPLARAKLRLALMEDSDREGIERDLADIERIANQFIAYLRELDHDSSRFTDVDLAQLIAERAHAWEGVNEGVSTDRIDACSVRGDAGALERALDNLIGNALAHGEPPVMIRGRREADKYVIEVEDRGPGIPEALRTEAIKPFVRLDASRGSGRSVQGERLAGPAVGSGGHCGLGLAVVHAVSRLHGGQLTLNNANDRGGLIASMALPVTKAVEPRPSRLRLAPSMA